MKEEVLFILSDDITDETVFAVLSALQSYESASILNTKSWNKVHKQDVKLDLSIWLVSPNRNYDFIFERCLTKLCGIFADVESTTSIDWTYVASISIAQAKAIALATELHLAIALGVLIGSEAKSLPDVSNLVSEYTQHKDWVCFDNCLLTKHRAVVDDELSISYFDSRFDSKRNKKSLELAAKEVFESIAVIGCSSFETYLACALQKPVFEVQINKGLYKWSNKKYLCATEFSDEAILKGVKQCLTLATGA